MAKSIHRAVLAVSLCIGLSSVAYAQIPVTDAVSASQRAAEFFKEANRWVETALYYERQIENLRRNARNIGSMSFSDVQRLTRQIRDLNSGITRWGSQSGRLYEKYESIFGIDDSTQPVSTKEYEENREQRSQERMETIRGVAAQVDRAAVSMEENAVRQATVQNHARQAQGDLEIMQALAESNSLVLDQLRDMQVLMAAQTELVMEQMARQEAEDVEYMERRNQMYDLSDLDDYEPRSFSPRSRRQ